MWNFHCLMVLYILTRYTWLFHWVPLSYLRISFLIFGSAVEHWSDAHSCPRSTDLVGAVLDKRIDGFTARSLALRSCYSITPKVHERASERRFYCTQRTWPPSSIVDGYSPLRRSKRKGMISSVQNTSSMFIRCAFLFKQR